MAKVPNIDPVRVLIADDERLVREILSQELGNDPSIEVVGVAKNGAETIAMIASHKPQVIVLDLEMPTCDGYSVQSFIRQHFPHVYTIIHTAHDDAERVINSLHNGADGYLVKGATTSEILSTIHAVHSGQAYFSKEIFRTFRLSQKPIENLENSWAEVPFYEEDKPIRTPSNVEVVPEQKKPKNNTRVNDFVRGLRQFSFVTSTHFGDN